MLTLCIICVIIVLMIDTLHIRIPKNLKSRLKKIASEQGRSMSDLVKEAIFLVIKKYDGGQSNVMQNMSEPKDM